MKGIGRHVPQQVTMDIHGGNRRCAVFSQASSIEPRHGNILGDAESALGQGLDDADRGQIVDSHHSRRSRRKSCDGQPSFQAALKAQISRQDGSRFQTQSAHAFFVSLLARDVGLEPRAPRDKGNPAVPELIEMLHHLLNA